MTAQKGLFNHVPNHAVFPIDTAIHNQNSQQIRNRHRLMSCLIVLAGILLLLTIAAVVGFICWKSVHSYCEECESEKSPIANDVMSTTDSDSDLDADNSRWSSFEDDLDQLIPTATDSFFVHPKDIVTSLQPETSVRAPPNAIQPTTSIDSQQIEIQEQQQNRRPWYARLPLIGWMFHSEEYNEERSTKITISK